MTSPRRRIRVAAVQMTIREGDTAGNWSRAREHLVRAGESGADLVILPEMWLTGFAYRRLSALSGKTPHSLREVGAEAKRFGLCVIGSWPEKEAGQVYNTAYVVGPDGEVRAVYRKVHLFRPMREDVFLAAGNSLTVAELEIGKIGVALCYDLRFPELVRKLALAGAELIAFPSQWPLERVAHLRTLLEARAIENQVYTAGANRTGRDSLLEFGGCSAIVGPQGEVLARCEREEGMAAADLDLAKVAAVRRKICYLQDRVRGIDEFLTR